MDKYRYIYRYIKLYIYIYIYKYIAKNNAKFFFNLKKECMVLLLSYFARFDLFCMTYETKKSAAFFCVLLKRT